MSNDAIRWSKQDDFFLKENIKKLSAKELAKNLNRTVTAIYTRASHLKLKKNLPIHLGEIFGKLKVLYDVPKRTAAGHKYFVCQCECGNIAEVIGGNLRYGQTKSCGCMAGGQSRRLEPGETSWNEKFKQYKLNATRRKLPFELSLDDFKEVASKNCHYCNAEPLLFNKFYTQEGIRVHSYFTISEEWAKLSAIKVNGIDRKDNSRGYEKFNCLPCCSTCNLAKSDRTYEEFLKYLDGLVKFRMDIKNS